MCIDQGYPAVSTPRFRIGNRKSGVLMKDGCIIRNIFYTICMFFEKGLALWGLFSRGGGGGGGGGLHSGTEGGGRTLVTYFAEEGAFFKTSACPRFCKRRVLFCTKVRSMGVKIPLQSTKYTRL